MKKTLALSVAVCALLISSPSFAQNAAAYETRLQALEDQMRSLNGQIEQTQYSVKQLSQSVQRLQSDYDARLSKLEQAAAQPAPAQQIPPPAPTVIPSPTEASGTLGAIKTTQNGQVTGATLNPQSTPLPTTPPDYGLTPQEQYEQAFDILRKADYAGAETAFRNFIDKNPKDKLVENAKYWYGETLYVQNKFDAAAVAFADAYQQNQKGNKAPDCLLKLAKSLGALNKNGDACTALTQLKTQFPNAAANIRSSASDERAKLKCGG